MLNQRLLYSAVYPKGKLYDSRNQGLEAAVIPLPITLIYLTNLCFSPSAIGCTSLEVLVPKQRTCLTKDTQTISLNYKQLLLGTSVSLWEGASKHEKE